MGGRFAAWMTAAAVVLIAYSAAGFTWMLLAAGDTSDEAPPPATDVAPAAARADALTLGREIVARHLFGQAPSLTPGAAIPETSLSLVLRGVVASPNPKTAAAIVADSSGNEQFYLVGQALPGGAVLKEVHRRRIVFSRDGRLETLRLPKESLQGGSDDTSGSDDGTVGVAPQAGALLQRYRDQFLQNPESLANLLQGEPYWDNGRLIGYRLRPGRDPRLLAQFGIQNGDVVTAVNGVSVVDAAGRLELLRKLPVATQVNLDLLRDGQPVTISIPVGGPT